MESEGATGVTEIMQPDLLCKALIESGGVFLMQRDYNLKIYKISAFSK